MIAKHKEQVLVTKAKKSYSEVLNAIKLYSAKNECSDITCISDTSQTSEQLADKLFAQFEGAKRCSASKRTGVCKSVPIKQNTPYYKDGVTATGDGITPKFIASNGTAYNVVQYSKCPRTTTSTKRDKDGYVVYDASGNPETITSTQYNCALFYFDVNGVENGPNQSGADIFSISLNYNGTLGISSLTPVLTKGKLQYTPYEVGKPKD